MYWKWCIGVLVLLFVALLSVTSACVAGESCRSGACRSRDLLIQTSAKEVNVKVSPAQVTVAEKCCDGCCKDCRCDKLPILKKAVRVVTSPVWAPIAVARERRARGKTCCGGP